MRLSLSGHDRLLCPPYLQVGGGSAGPPESSGGRVGRTGVPGALPGLGISGKEQLVCP